MDTDQPGAESGAAGTPSIEDTLSAAFDHAQEAETPNAGGEQDDKSGEAAAAEAPPADTETTPEEGAETTDADSTKDAGTAETLLSPPERWSAADKEEFKALSPDAQKLVLKREGDVERYLTQETQKIAEIKRNYEPLERHIAPRREAWALQGFTPDAALEHLFALSDFATRDKPAFMRWFAQQGQPVDLAELASSGASAPDPQIQALSQEVQSLKQADQQRQQQARDTFRQSVNSAIQEFAGDTKTHPHYKDVEDDIASMLPGIMQQKPGASHKELLQIAYDKATWANDGVRSKIMAEQKKAEDLKAAQAAEKAKKAAGGNVKTSGSLPDGRRKLTMDETLAAAYDQSTARA